MASRRPLVSRKQLLEWERAGKITYSSGPGPEAARRPPPSPQGMTRAEKLAGNWIAADRGLALPDEFRADAVFPRLAFEPFTVRLRNHITYRPDWVIWWNPWRRDIFEVKEVQYNREGRRVAKGFRIRETRAKLSWVKEKGEMFGWRVFLVLVDKGSVVQEEIA